MQYQTKLIEAIRFRLSYIHSSEGYKEYRRGPLANTRRIIVMGFKIYFSVETEENVVRVKGIKAPRMK